MSGSHSSTVEIRMPEHEATVTVLPFKGLVSISIRPRDAEPTELLLSKEEAQHLAEAIAQASRSSLI